LKNWGILSGLFLKKYKYIFFDIDRTLWDYDRNSAKLIKELIAKYNLDKITDFQISSKRN